MIKSNQIRFRNIISLTLFRFISCGDSMNQITIMQIMAQIIKQYCGSSVFPNISGAKINNTSSSKIHNIFSALISCNITFAVKTYPPTQDLIIVKCANNNQIQLIFTAFMLAQTNFAVGTWIITWPYVIKIEKQQFIQHNICLIE